MTRAWTDMARIALQGARLWRTAVRRHRIDEGDLGFATADVIVLSLLLDLQDVEVVVCASERLVDLLGETWAADSASASRLLLATPDGTPHVRLSALRDAGGRPAEAQSLELAYGLGCGFALAECPQTGQGTRLRPLSTVSPALWQCGLALLVPDGAAATEAFVVANLAQAMRGEWIDPLVLYEQVQRLSARLKSLGQAEETDTAARADRIGELEHEIASLKRAALVSQHLLLVDAVERTRGTS